MIRFKHFSELQPVRQALAERAAREQAERASAEHAARRRQAAANLFIDAVGVVQPLSGRPKVLLKRELPAPLALQQQRDEQAVLRQTLSDAFDVGTLLDADAGLSFRRTGIGPDVTRRLRRGEWAIQREIDLHGLRSQDARAALAEFIRSAHRHGLRCVRVIHGKGLGSPGKMPVLKNQVQSWLVQKKQVAAFVQARPTDGGSGALVVLLQPAVRSS